jgi:photosystem II stability/assembly factor-like uncharacterized protein
MLSVARFVVCSLGVAIATGCTLYEACPIPTGTQQPPGNVPSVIDTTTDAPSEKWSNATGNLAGLDSECGNLSFLSASPNEDRLIVGVAAQGLWSSDDGGDSWQALGTAGDPITNRTSAIVYDPDVAGRFWESGTYNGGGVFETEDDGETFSQLGEISHVDLVSVDFTDTGRKTLLAGGHEAARSIYRSVDRGKTWKSIAANLPDGTNCSYPLVVNARVYLVGCGGYGGGLSGIFRSTDAGSTWAMVSNTGGTSAPLKTSDGALYWVGPNGAMARSADGVTWKDVVPAGVLRGVTPLELPDGSIAALSANNVIVSKDDGASWVRVSSQLPFSDSAGLAYSKEQQAFFVWHFTCGFNGAVPVPDDAVMRYDFASKSP